MFPLALGETTRLFNNHKNKCVRSNDDRCWKGKERSCSVASVDTGIPTGGRRVGKSFLREWPLDWNWKAGWALMRWRAWGWRASWRGFQVEGAAWECLWGIRDMAQALRTDSPCGCPWESKPTLRIVAFILKTIGGADGFCSRGGGARETWGLTGRGNGGYRQTNQRGWGWGWDQDRERDKEKGDT